MCKIKEMLQKKGPVFNVVTPETKVVEALNIMKSENLSYVVVMQDGNYLGIMSERDYTHKVKLQGRKSETTTVKDIMSSDYPVVGYGEDLQRCMVLMNVYKTRYLPIFDEMNFQGVLTMNDLMREVIAKDNLIKPDSDSLYEL
jgi:signal-transduction protein with cAMP-binding, CBS, and nucleotidyltransferase domain